MAAVAIFNVGRRFRASAVHAIHGTESSYAGLAPNLQATKVCKGRQVVWTLRTINRRPRMNGS